MPDNPTSFTASEIGEFWHVLREGRVGEPTTGSFSVPEYIISVKTKLIEIIVNETENYGRYTPTPNVDMTIGNDNIGKLVLTFPSESLLKTTKIIITINNIVNKAPRSVAFSIITMLQSMVGVDINVCYLSMKKGGI